MRQWVFLCWFYGGHKYFKEVVDGLETGRIGVADASGREPHLTDDGVLYLDVRRHVAEEYDSVIPLHDSNGRRFLSPAYSDEAFAIRNLARTWLLKTSTQSASGMV